MKPIAAAALLLVPLAAHAQDTRPPLPIEPFTDYRTDEYGQLSCGVQASPQIRITGTRASFTAVPRQAGTRASLVFGSSGGPFTSRLFLPKVNRIAAPVGEIRILVDGKQVRQYPRSRLPEPEEGAEDIEISRLDILRGPMRQGRELIVEIFDARGATLRTYSFDVSAYRAFEWLVENKVRCAPR